jgi:hypothetical protein
MTLCNSCMVFEKVVRLLLHLQCIFSHCKKVTAVSITVVPITLVVTISFWPDDLVRIFVSGTPRQVAITILISANSGWVCFVLK